MSEFIKSHKTYVIALSVLTLYFVIILTVALIYNWLYSKNAIIVVDGVFAIEYEGFEWKYIYNYDEDIDSETKFNIYSHNNYYGEYTIKVNNDKIYAFDEDMNSLQYKDSIIAFYSNYNINFYKFDYTSIDDNDRLILEEIIDNNKGYNYSIKKITLSQTNEEDEEKTKEEIFYIANFYDTSGNLLNSSLYYYNEELQEIISSNSLSTYIYNIEYIIDIDNDNKYEIITSTNYMDNITYNIYKKTNKGYEIYIN